MVKPDHPGDTNRQPFVAGSFYPANPDTLNNIVGSYIKDKEDCRHSLKTRALIAPHAGYVYSGSVAGAAYASVDSWHNYDKVFIIGSSHRHRFNGAALYADGDFITPLGVVKVDRSICRNLIESSKLFTNYPEAHIDEHSIEVQLPFLQYLMKEKLSIVPILLGTDKPEDCREIANSLKTWFGPRNLFIISSDFSHFPEYSKAVELDSITSEIFLNSSPDDFAEWISKCEKAQSYGALTPMCGWTAGLVIKHLAESANDINFIHLDYENSGDSVKGDKEGVVGYHAIALVEEEKNFEISEKNKARLLKIARDNIESRLYSGNFISSSGSEPDSELSQSLGAFVTLRLGTKLRGCIGRLNASEPLFETIKQMSVAAAFNDSRFSPLKRDELKKLRIEISILSEMKKINDIEEIITGKHGVYIKKGTITATFLPQVATEQKWNREELLGHLSDKKAGLGWLGWKDADIYIYEAIVFEENENH